MDRPGSRRRHASCKDRAHLILILPQFHADSGGSFEIVQLQGQDGQGGALMQMSPLYPSLTEWVADYDPITTLGDANWAVIHRH